jgi:NitT/TauT family transport system substrate-binding protein
MGKKTGYLLVLVVAVLACAAYAVTLFPTQPVRSPGTPESITIGTTPNELSTLIWIAQERGFFAKNGLNVTVKTYDTGLSSVNGLLGGESHLATISEYVYVSKIFSGENLTALGSIAKTDNEYLIARKDRGIQNITDLRGKKVGITRKTTNEFFFGRLLNLNNVPIQDITVVDVKPQQMANALAGGDVDAVLTWNPGAGTVIRRLGASNVSVWQAQSNQYKYWLLVSRQDLVNRSPATITRVLRSLDEAETFTDNNPDEARTIVQERWHLDNATLRDSWGENQFAISLDQSLIIAMEDEARWLIQNNLTTKTNVPVFTDNLYVAGLETVSPESVNIIR